jgi:hypothetical protein
MRRSTQEAYIAKPSVCEFIHANVGRIPLKRLCSG